MRLSSVIRGLIDRAWFFQWHHPLHVGSRKINNTHFHKPGELVENLSPGERDTLKDLKAEHLNDRLDVATMYQVERPGRRGRYGQALDDQREWARKQAERNKK